MNDLDKSHSDSEQNFVINDSIKLPKLKNKHINLGKIKNNNSLNTKLDKLSEPTKKFIFECKNF